MNNPLAGIFGYKNAFYQELLDMEKGKNKLLEEAYIKQKERYDCLHKITIDLIKVMVKDDLEQDGSLVQDKILKILQDGLYD